MAKGNDFQELISGIFALIVLFVMASILAIDFPEIGVIVKFISAIFGIVVFLMILFLVLKILELFNKVF